VAGQFRRGTRPIKVLFSIDEHEDSHVRHILSDRHLDKMLLSHAAEIAALRGFIFHPSLAVLSSSLATAALSPGFFALAICSANVSFTRFRAARWAAVSGTAIFGGEPSGAGAAAAAKDNTLSANRT
jgi:hypothetical protein